MGVFGPAGGGDRRNQRSAPACLVQGVLAVVLSAALVSCGAHVPLGETAPQQPASQRGAPPLARELIEAGNLVAAGFDLYSVGAEIPADIAVSPDDAKAGLQRLVGADAAIAWIGHASVLIRVDGVTILTDPIFSERALSEALGPRRLAPLPLDIRDLPQVDVILISHADVDHLDRRSLRRLAERFPRAAVVIPQRNAALLEGIGFADLRELRWHESTTVGAVTLRALPAYHGNRREPGNPFARAWAGFGIEGEKQRIFFAGDTGYGPAFKEVRQRHGAYDTALVPIGAYEPRAAVKEIHADPEEAAEIARDVGASLAVGIHWGTFALSPEPFLDPPRRFLAAGGNGIAARTLRIGETLVLR